jgi:hypothetical protein
MERHRNMERQPIILFILLMLAGFVAKSQNPYIGRYYRINPTDTSAFTDPATIRFPTNTAGFYYNVSTGYIMYKDATGYHKLIAGGSGGGGGGGTIVGVNGTTNELDATGTTTRTLSISPVFKATLGYISNPLSQFAATTSAQLAGILTNESGTGFIAMTTNPVFTTPNLGIPSALTLTNATGLPFSGLNVFNSADLSGKLSNETGSGLAVFGTSPTLITPALGTPSALVLTNATGLPITGINAATSAQLAALLSDETSSGSLYFGQPTGANTSFAGSHTMATTDVGNNNTGIVRITGASPSTVTYPANATAALPLYSLISVINQSTDTVTVAFAGGVTHNDNGDLEIPPHGVGSFYKIATNTVDYFGSSAGGTGGGITECLTLYATFATAKTVDTDDFSTCNNSGFITYTGSADVNLTVPLFATEAFQDGSTLGINNQSSFTITVVFTGGVAGGGHSLNTIPAGETGLLYFRDNDVVDLLGTRSPTEDLIATATLDFGNTAAGAIADLTVTVTGAVVGDVVAIGAPSIPNKGTYFAYVSATNTVTVRYANNDLTTAKDPSSGSFKVRVFK